MGMMLTKTVFAALLLSSVGGLHAQETESQAVHRRAGESRATTIRHIEAAAYDICGAPGFSLSEMRDAVRRSDCWRDAVAAARAQMDRDSAPAANRGQGRS